MPKKLHLFGGWVKASLIVLFVFATLFSGLLYADIDTSPCPDGTAYGKCSTATPGYWCTGSPGNHALMEYSSLCSTTNQSNQIQPTTDTSPCVDGTAYGKCSTVSPGNWCTGSPGAHALMQYVALCVCTAVPGWAQQGSGDTATCVHNLDDVQVNGARHELTVNVVVDQDTPSIGATVSLVSGGFVISTQKTNTLGVAAFNVKDGSYFVVVNKSIIYPQYIVLKEVSGDSSIRIVRRQLINYANAYGQVSGGSSVTDTTVSAYADGQVAKRVAVNKDGFYILSFLNEGTYELRFESPGMKTQRVQVFLPASEFTPINTVLFTSESHDEVNNGKCSDGTEDGMCSVSKPKKCMNGALVDDSVTCGCSPGQSAEGTGCKILERECPPEISQVCNNTNVTVDVNITYVFDWGYNKTVTESRTYENESCYSVKNKYGGSDCSQLIESAPYGAAFGHSATGFETIKKVTCGRCPSICTKNPPSGLECGKCGCPANLGFCEVSGLRQQLNLTAVYCFDELWQPQKDDNSSCQNNFECKSNFCSNGACYNIVYEVKQNKDILQSILDWLKRMFNF